MKAIWQGNRKDLTLKSHQLQQSQSIVWLAGLNYTGSVILCHSLKAGRIIIQKCNTVGHTTKGRCVWVDSTHQMWVLSAVIAGRLYGSEKAIYRFMLLMESKLGNAEVLEYQNGQVWTQRTHKFKNHRSMQHLCRKYTLVCSSSTTYRTCTGQVMVIAPIPSDPVNIKTCGKC